MTDMSMDYLTSATLRRLKELQSTKERLARLEARAEWMQDLEVERKKVGQNTQAVDS
jgi:flagellar motility protein MotE (MotC chaperone)